MAAALFNKIAMEKDLDVRIESAGLFANDGDGASKNSIEAMKDYDIDLSGHCAKTVNAELLEQVDLALTMTASHKMMLTKYLGDKVYTLCEFAQVKISRYEVTCVLDFKRVTTATSPAFEGHYAIGHSVYGRACRCSIVYSQVWAINSVYRMQS